MSGSVCISCGTKPVVSGFSICSNCVKNSMEKECVICGCGPFAPMEHMRRVKLKLCSGCKSQWYCGRAHQKTDWQFHKYFCKDLEQLQYIVSQKFSKDFRCTGCGKLPKEGRTNFKKCSSCHTARYCSKECQRMNFDHHKMICGRLLKMHNEK